MVVATDWADVMGRKAGALLMEASKSGVGDGGANESNGVPCQGAASPWHGENGKYWALPLRAQDKADRPQVAR